MAKWILKEILASERGKQPIYFSGITAIGPMSTPNLARAQRFSSKQEAMMSPAYVHPLSFYEPEIEPVTGADSK